MRIFLKYISGLLPFLFLSGILCSGTDRDSTDTNVRSASVILSFPFSSDLLCLKNTAGGFAYSRMPAVSKVSIAADFRNEEAPLLWQEGKSYYGGRFDAMSVLRPNKTTAVRGGASYSSGIKKEVKWNSTSDYGLLNPYFLADSLGGDRRIECYKFNGAYAHTRGSILYAASGRYRASHEWGEYDPRPRNVSSDLETGLSLGYLFRKYVFSLSASFRIYNQNQHVRFVNEEGSNAIEWHFTGLGSNMARFAGTNNFVGTRYTGKGCTIAALVQPLIAHGFNIGVIYRNIYINRLLVAQNYAPITRLGRHNADVYISYRRKSGNYTFGAEAAGFTEFKRGIENVIDNGATGSFFKLASLPMFKSDMSAARIAALMQAEIKKSTLLFQPTLTMTGNRSEYRFPYKYISMNRLFVDIRTGWLRHSGQWLFYAEYKCIYKSGLMKSISIEDKDMDKSIRRHFVEQFEKETTNMVSNHITVLTQRTIKNIGSISVSANWENRFFLSGIRGNIARASVSFVF